MEDVLLIEEKLYEQIREKFINPCSEDMVSKVHTDLYTIKEVRVGTCTLFDRVRFFYRHFESADRSKKIYMVIAQFDSPQFPRLQSCFPVAWAAKDFFNTLQKEFCEL